MKLLGVLNRPMLKYGLMAIIWVNFSIKLASGLSTYLHDKYLIFFIV